jgi:hypothetical protein
MDWRELEALIREERRAGNPVAGAIHSLQLDQNKITLLLSNLLDGEEVRAVGVDVQHWCGKCVAVFVAGEPAACCLVCAVWVQQRWYAGSTAVLSLCLLCLTGFGFETIKPS